jgi:hypothetical protein
VTDICRDDADVLVGNVGVARPELEAVSAPVASVIAARDARPARRRKVRRTGINVTGGPRRGQRQRSPGGVARAAGGSRATYPA